MFPTSAFMVSFWPSPCKINEVLSGAREQLCEALAGRPVCVSGKFQYISEARNQSLTALKLHGQCDYSR